MLVERTCEVALEQLIVVDSLSDDAANKFKVAKMIGIAVRGWVDHVGDTVARRGGEERVHRVENLSRTDNIPEIQGQENLQKTSENIMILW